jgi:hypothetical protein
MVFILWISNFLPRLFCKTIIDFQFQPSIQIDYIMFSNLILIVLIFIFFPDIFVKIIILFNFIIQLQFYF